MLYPLSYIPRNGWIRTSDPRRQLRSNSCYGTHHIVLFSKSIFDLRVQKYGLFVRRPSKCKMQGLQMPSVALAEIAMHGCLPYHTRCDPMPLLKPCSVLGGIFLQTNCSDWQVAQHSQPNLYQPIVCHILAHSS